MKTIMKCGFTFAWTVAASQAASAQATITGPSTWVAGQPTTVTWTGTVSPVCQTGVRVTLNLGSSKIQTGTAVPVSAGKAAIPGATLSAGTAVTLTLTDQCTGKVVSAARSVTITGSSAPVVPVAAASTTTITPQIRQNIDTACQGVLGAACSTNVSYSSTYNAITQQITQGSLKSDSSSVMYNYLIPMVQSSTSWKTNVVDNAWRGAGCTGAAPEAQWTPKVAQLQTYQAVVSAIKQQGCAAAAGNVATANAATQYVTAQQMSAAYAQVWGNAASSAAVRSNCPVTTGAVSCARTDLAAYVKSHNTGVLISVAAADYSSVIGAAMTSTQAQTIQNAFGVNWSGADDLVTYLKNNPALFPPTRVFGGLSSEGCLIDNLRIKLDTNEPCGMYFLDSAGAHAPGAYPASFQGARFTLSTANPGGGVLVSNSGVLLKIVSTGTKWAIGNNIVAQGGGNIVAQGGGNIVAQGGGNIVAQGGGNIVAQGGGNIVAQGGGNLINDGAQYLKALTFVDASTAASAAHLITPGGASIISQDGNGFLPNMSQVAAVAKLIGQNSLGIASAGGAGVISAKPGASLGDNAGGIALSSAAQSASTNSAIATQSASRVIGENSSGIVGFNGSGVTANNPLLTDNGAAAVYSAQSVSAGQAAVITGPSAWTAGQSAMITWSPIPNTAACASGYRVLLNGNIQTGNATALSVGKSLVQPTTFTKGTKVSISLVSLCNGNPVAIPYTSIIQ